ncbi:hypothetical protein [Pseudomonas congelans]|uniref:hypothetical protein n=1 Tax=Pseudomonas congelans TaxID=200452 RepID=UPI0004E3DAB8|nr:hypothetical protein [Pseudomonas congelans]KFE48023.1 hypothetical protein IV03_08145 [Pseudomonas congelans]
MIIKLSPQRREGTLEVVKKGDVLVVNGEEFDFSTMPEGATLPVAAIRSEWFFSDVDRVDGELIMTMWLPLPANYSQEQASPVDLIDIPDGPVAFPKPLPPTPVDEVSGQ